MAYESPIEVTIQNMMDSIIKSIEESRENAIVAQISEAYGVSVNKEELAKALAFDRGQYEKGYAEAMAAMSGTVKELNRLQSLEVHADTYEDGSFLFNYHEFKAGICTIGVWDGMCKPQIEHFSIESPLSHDEFVAWCNAYTRRHKEHGSDGV